MPENILVVVDDKRKVIRAKIGGICILTRPDGTPTAEIPLSMCDFKGKAGYFSFGGEKDGD